MFKLQNIKDAGFIYESFQNKTNRVIWDFCFHKTNTQNEPVKNRPTNQIQETNLLNTVGQNKSTKRIF
jgi:hypothetical protein